MSDSRKLYNERALLLLIHPERPNFAPVGMYCRITKTLIYEGHRFYHIKEASSLTGAIYKDGPRYIVHQAMLRDTRRRFGADGKEIKK